MFEPVSKHSMRRIGVMPFVRGSGFERVLDAIAEIEPVEFVSTTAVDSTDVDALVVIDPAVALSLLRVPALVFSWDGSRPTTRTAHVTFSSSSGLVGPLRSQSIGPLEIVSGPMPSGGETLASSGDEALWVRHVQDGIPIDLVATRVPEMRDEHHLFQLFQRDRFMELLPLLHFVKGLTADTAQDFPLRANFMFDDPNLHAPTFGFIDYESLAQSARKHHFHASFATVPLDGWYVSRRAADIFARHPDQLSFLVHGNNHTREELAQPYPSDVSIALAAQALRRIEKIERRSGIPVSRVMAAPHGACSENVAESLFRAGFNAACISRGSLMYYNKARTWPVSVGMQPAEFTTAGFPVIPRLRLAADAQPQILLAAVLQQPLIMVGHHDDLRHGYEILEDLAQFINSLGNVRWENLDRIAQGNVIVRRTASKVDVATYSSRTRWQMPTGATELTVRLPTTLVDASAGLRFTLLVDNKPHDVRFNGSLSNSVPTSPGADVEFSFRPQSAIQFADVLQPRLQAWAIVRRVLAEGRDRCAPIRKHLAGK